MNEGKMPQKEEQAFAYNEASPCDEETGGSHQHQVSNSPTTEEETTKNKILLDLQTYMSSPEIKEFLACLGMFLVITIFYALEPSPNQRPIPYEYFQDSGEYVRNLSYNEAYRGETVSTVMLAFLSGVLPLVIQFFLSLRFGQKGDCHKTLCVYFLSNSLTLLVTECIKLYVGYLRPLFFAVCQPNDDYSECNEPSDEVRKSFISGHSSAAFCGLMVLSLFLHNRFGLPSVRVLVQQDIIPVNGSSSSPIRIFRVGYQTKSQRSAAYYRFVSILSLAPLALATFIATSRLYDNKHFPADVVGGSVVGSVMAIFVNGLWFEEGTMPIVLSS